MIAADLWASRYGSQCPRCGRWVASSETEVISELALAGSSAGCGFQLGGMDANQRRLFLEYLALLLNDAVERVEIMVLQGGHAFAM